MTDEAQGLEAIPRQKVTLRITDGEIVKVKIRIVDEEYDDLIVDVLETSSPELYRNPQAAYTFAATEIKSAELVP